MLFRSKEISEVLQRKINDSRIGFISILDVKLSKDLDHAWVYYSQIGSEEEIQITKKGLASATKFIKNEIGKVLKIKTIPDIHFRYDDSLVRGTEIVEKLKELES